MGNKNVKKPDLKNGVELKEVPEYRRKEFLKGYNELLKSMPQIRKEREEIIKRHFGEITLYNMKDVQDMDIKIAEIIGKGQTYPTLYLASSLGFNKITWSKGVERILSQFGTHRGLKS
jgi:hypothetical protein